jgi:hypothetical protein
MGETITIRTGAATEVIKVVEQGPQGPVGPKGDPGDVAGLPLTTTGDTLYRANSTTNARLPIGAAGQILKVAASGIPEWGNESGAVSSVAGRTGAVTLNSTDISSEQALEVYEAGTADCNGLYIYGGLFNGRPTYYATKDTFIYWDGSNWIINYNGEDQYFGTAAIRPWDSAWSLGEGSNPLPVVDQVSSRVFEQVVGQRTNPTAFGTASVKNVGTGANDVAAGNHTHGNLTNAGAIGITANLPLRTGTNGVVEAGSFGTSAGSFCEGNDARLSDDRDPNLHAASHLPDGADEIFDQSLNEADDVTFNEVTTDVVTCSAFADASENTQLQFDDGIHRLINNLTETVTVSDSDASFAVPIAFGGEDAATNAATTRDNLGLGDAATEDATAFAASGSITTSGLTQATARILGRTSSSTGAVEEITIGAGLSLSAGELSSTVSAGIPATLLDAKGDLIVGSAADTAARLAVGGTNGHVLTVDSSETLGVKWAAASYVGAPIEYVIACSDETSDLATGTAKVTFRAPVAFLLTAVAASVNTAPTGSTLIVDINNGANSTLSTKLSIDASEKTSATAASAAVIDTTYDDIAADAEITIDIDQIGSTVAGKGLKVILRGTRA